MVNKIISDDNNADKNTFFSNLGLSQTPNSDKAKHIRDELISLFDDLEVKEDTIPNQQSSSSEDDYENEYCESKVAAALKKLEEDSYDDVEWSSESE